MKTAISVPDATFTRVERVARAHGLNRSQFFAAAAEAYADALEGDALTAAIDAAAHEAGQDSSSRFAVAAASRVLEVPGDEW